MISKPQPRDSFSLVDTGECWMIFGGDCSNQSLNDAWIVNKNLLRWLINVIINHIGVILICDPIHGCEIVPLRGQVASTLHPRRGGCSPTVPLRRCFIPRSSLSNGIITRRGQVHLDWRCDSPSGEYPHNTGDRTMWCGSQIDLSRWSSIGALLLIQPIGVRQCLDELRWPGCGCIQW